MRPPTPRLWRRYDTVRFQLVLALEALDRLLRVPVEIAIRTPCLITNGFKHDLRVLHIRAIGVVLIGFLLIDRCNGKVFRL